MLKVVNVFLGDDSTRLIGRQTELAHKADNKTIIQKGKQTLNRQWVGQWAPGNQLAYDCVGK